VSSTQPGWAEINVARVSDGSDMAFRIPCRVRKQNNMTIGRVRWIRRTRPGAPDALAFIGQDENGSTGVFIQKFVPGSDTANSRTQLRPFDFRAPVETLGVSPDGKAFVICIADDTTSVMLAKGVPGLNRTRRR